ncbi:hypothetical protein JF544_02245 [Halobacillus kuroshimensis]|uniref:Lipoprotein n=1 Tax=Halobacillus kuroshimensis TaxID=302481 RepID=A0ABS3DRT1_9BACI|nr:MULTISPECIES: hypothetical protein [Halobacillus]MBN8234043.1 hypothetical protein [Halobacillus kuroshimensis]
MFSILRFTVGLGCIIFLSGCFGESYDFSSPEITLTSSHLMSEDTYDLAKASVDWEGEAHEETNDFQAFASEQEVIQVNSGSTASLTLSHQDFQLDDFQVSLWKGDEEEELDLEYGEFEFPDSTGSYVLEVNISSESGNVQYAGNIEVINIHSKNG